MKTEQMPLVKREELALDRPQPTVADMLQAVIEKGVTAENVAAVGELVKLYERMEDKKAEKEFAAAFIALQKELPTIDGSRPIPDKNGRTKFCYANFEDIDEIVRPICLRHGFSYAFREDSIKDGRVTMTMLLQHSGGHTREFPYSVRIGSGPPGANESQADGSGHTYAQRGAIESGLSLRIIGRPDDARMEGGPITEAQAEELERRIKLLNDDTGRWLKLAGAKSFKEIHSAKYDILDQLLARKEKTS